MFICCNVGMKEIGQTKALFVKAIHFSVAIQDIGGEERRESKRMLTSAVTKAR